MHAHTFTFCACVHILVVCSKGLDMDGNSYNLDLVQPGTNSTMLSIQFFMDKHILHIHKMTVSLCKHLYVSSR
jgi:hypothetical protein